jgi:ABC-type sugar transport system ATPase subunit
MTALLELDGISKRFGGVHALRRASLAVEAGEVRGLVGENGSGKTTLLRVLAGELSPDEGTVAVDGQVLATLDARARLESGVGVVFQEAHVCPDLTVAENMMLGRLPSKRGLVTWRATRRAAERVLRDANIPLDPRRRVGSISQDARHLTEVARVLARGCRVIAFDETTASLTADYVEIVFEVIRRAKAAGAAVIFISHRLHEVFAICDTITVLRDGEVRGTLNAANVGEDDVIRLMVGRDLESQFFREPADLGEPLLHIEDVVSPPLAHGVSLEVRAGEVVGLGGLVGSGRTELLEAVFGLRPRTGDVTVGSRQVRAGDPRIAIRAGLAFVPEDRRSQGLAMAQSVRLNATMALTGRRSLAAPTSRSAEAEILRGLYERLQLRAPSAEAPVRTLSGGNQQKVVVGRWLASRPHVLLLDEPTRGIDVGAKREIYGLIDALAQAGAAILLVSSELPELLGLCDRIVVLREGRVVRAFERGATEEALAAAMAGAAVAA